MAEAVSCLEEPAQLIVLVFVPSIANEIIFDPDDATFSVVSAINEQFDTSVELQVSVTSSFGKELGCPNASVIEGFVFWELLVLLLLPPPPPHEVNSKMHVMLKVLTVLLVI